MILTLPFPVLINKTYKTSSTGGRFYKDQSAKDWEVEAGWEIKRQWSEKPFEGDVIVVLTFYYKNDPDIDGGIKITLDLLQRQRVYINDKQVVTLLVAKHKDSKYPRLEVFVGGKYNRIDINVNSLEGLERSEEVSYSQSLKFEGIS